MLDDLDGCVRHRADRLEFPRPETFPGGDPALGPDDDSLGLRVLGQRPQQFRPPLEESQAGELRHQPSIVPINGQARESVGLAEQQPASRPRPGVQPQDALPHPDGRFQPAPPEALIERPLVPSIEPHPDRAGRVVQSPRDEFALGARHVDFRAGGRIPLDPLDRRIEDPGVASEERPRPARLQDHSTAGTHRQGRSSRIAVSPRQLPRRRRPT